MNESFENPRHKLFANDHFISFLETNPLTYGHAVVAPKNKTDYFFDLPDKELAELMTFSKKVAAAIKKAVPCEKVAVIVYGLKVRHVHVHLVPAHGAPGELDISRPRAAAEENLLEELSKKIKELV
jgi:histidine triad (HIT) family protein